VEYGAVEEAFHLCVKEAEPRVRDSKRALFSDVESVAPEHKPEWYLAASRAVALEQRLSRCIVIERCSEDDQPEIRC
jgi:hypothetical protein